VIVRVDFSAPIEELGRGLQPRIKEAALRAFPISEPKRVKAQELQFGKGGVRHVESEVTEWHFYGRDREKRLTVSPISLLATYSSYTSYEVLRDEFSTVLTALCEAFRDTTASRVGLRYINNVEKDGEPFVWNQFIDNGLLGLLTRFADPDHVNRIFHIVEYLYDDLGVKFQFGLANPDFPAMIRKALFVLDFDGYTQGSQDLREILTNIERAHERIQDLFEHSITDNLRQTMHVKQPA
jgi:uncharacterized protein (TIGR04255 family)